MAGNGTSLIQLQGVKKVFYTDEVETHALADVHLDIRAGEYVSIAGPSGCGKTTLLSLLGLLDTPTEGVYLLEDRPVANLSAAERARIRNRRSEEHTSELQSRRDLVCRLLLEKKKKQKHKIGRTAHA